VLTNESTDGDLGSNEILLSSDKTVAIIDGSGVLADPAGLDRAELIRLAKLRVPVSHFDKSKLGKAGYLVCVEEHDVKLPCECARRWAEEKLTSHSGRARYRWDGLPERRAPAI
jgi:NAD-specific glutamate dehydrogenase